MQTDREQLREQYRDAGNLQARSAIYRFGDPAAMPWPRWVFDQLASIVPVGAPAQILEIGCGDGGLWKRNSDRLPPAWRITMLDLSLGMLTAARDALPAAPFAFAQADAERLPLADARFDAVVANHMIYHLSERVRALHDVRRVLKPGAPLLAGTNSETHMAPIKRLIGEFVGEHALFGGDSPFNLENGEAQLRAAGFTSVEVRHTRGELRVTDADAVVAYVMSVESAPETITGERLAALRRSVDDEIARRGAFVSPTAAGVFVVRARA